ncbi:hypothetical protein [Glaesserella parasuis]|nr:hypothetical protein [Glaesserella parasuis]MWQ04724.1 hypothetical protein [Glaesserella parasuis]
MLSTLARYLLRNDENFKKLDAMLSKPEDWGFDGYTLDHRTKGISLWMSNGIFFFCIYEFDEDEDIIDVDSEIKFSFLMKLALWNKAKK